MKIKVDLRDDDYDRVIADAMLDVLDSTKRRYKHKEDREYYRKLRKAAVRMFRHFTTQDRWSEVE